MEFHPMERMKKTLHWLEREEISNQTRIQLRGQEEIFGHN